MLWFNKVKTWDLIIQKVNIITFFNVVLYYLKSCKLNTKTHSPKVFEIISRLKIYPAVLYTCTLQYLRNPENAVIEVEFKKKNSNHISGHLTFLYEMTYTWISPPGKVQCAVLQVGTSGNDDEDNNNM